MSVEKTVTHPDSPAPLETRQRPACATARALPELDWQGAEQYLNADDLQALDARGPRPGQRIVAKVAALPAPPDMSGPVGQPNGGEDRPAECQRCRTAGPSADAETARAYLSTQLAGTGGAQAGDLIRKYRELLDSGWIGDFRLGRRLGRGGQGEVFETRLHGSDGFRVRVALKVFSPTAYQTPAAYDSGMRRIAPVATRIAQTNQEHLVGIHRFEAYAGIRVMLMELVKGLDLRRLLDRKRIAGLKGHPQVTDQLCASGPMSCSGCCRTPGPCCSRPAWR